MLIRYLSCLFSLFSLSLVLPGREHRINSPSRHLHPKKQGLAAVSSTGWRGHNSKDRNRSRSTNGQENRRERGRRRRGRRWGGEEPSDLERPSSKKGERSQEGRDGRRRTRKRESQSLPRDAFRNYDDSEKEKATARGRKKEKGRSKVRMTMTDGEKQDEQEDKEEAPAIQQSVEERAEEAWEEVDVGRAEDIILPIPGPVKKLPRPKQSRELVYDDKCNMAGERSHDDDRAELSEDKLDEELLGECKTTRFSFLTSAPFEEQLGDTESESGGSESDGNVSAASISGLSLLASEGGMRRAEVLPGPWLTPGQQGVARVSGEKSQGTGRSAVH